MRTPISGGFHRSAVCGIAVLALAGCGSSSSTTTSPPPSSTPGTVTISMSPQPTSSAPAGAKNLQVTPQVRADLVAAGAKARGLTASDFTGLRKGMTYYAFDPKTQTSWAGGELVPSMKSYRAQVSSQDDGAYTLFSRTASGTWTAMDEGMAGPNSAPGNAGCRVMPPPSILALWGWPAKSCHPNGV